MNVLVIGSGIVGLSAAFELALAGHSVRVITRNYEEGASWVAGGMLAPFSELLEGDLLDFSLYSLELYDDYIKRLEEVSRVKLFYEGPGAILRLAFDPDTRERIASYSEKVLKRGLKVRELTPEEALKLEPHLAKDLEGAWVFEREGNVDAERLMDALLFAMENLGVKIDIDDIYKVELKDRAVGAVRGYKKEYTADFYVFALGAWARSLFGIPVFPNKGQILKAKGIEINMVLFSEPAYIIPKDGYLLVGATSEDAGFDTRVTLGGAKSLTEGAIRVVPALENAELVAVKTGFRPATPDEKPIFELGENYSLLTGHYRNGILWAPASARILTDYLETSRVSPYFELFGPKRFTGRK
jgi:glycine oxidase